MLFKKGSVGTGGETPRERERTVFRPLSRLPPVLTSVTGGTQHTVLHATLLLPTTEHAGRPLAYLSRAEKEDGERRRGNTGKELADRVNTAGVTGAWPRTLIQFHVPATH